MLKVRRGDLRRLRSESLPYVRHPGFLHARKVLEDHVEIVRATGHLRASAGEWIIRDGDDPGADEWPVSGSAFSGSYDVPGRDGDPDDECLCVSMGWTSLCLMPTEFEIESTDRHLGPPHHGEAGDYLAFGPDGEYWVVGRSTVDERLVLVEDPAPGKLKYFLSYASGDFAQIGVFLKDLKQRLLTRDAAVFLDIDGIGAGDQWARTIAGEIAWADYFLVAVDTDWLRRSDRFARRFELPLALRARDEHGCKISVIHDHEHANDDELTLAATSLEGKRVSLLDFQNQTGDMANSDGDERYRLVDETTTVLLGAWSQRAARLGVTSRRSEARNEALELLAAAPPPALTVERGQGVWRLWPQSEGGTDVLGVIGRSLTFLGTGDRVQDVGEELPVRMVASDDRSVVLMQAAHGLLWIEAGTRVRAAGRRSLGVRSIPPIEGLGTLLAVRRDGRSLALLFCGDGKTWECRVDSQGRTFGRHLLLDTAARIAAARPPSFLAYGDTGDRPALGVKPQFAPDGATPVAVASCVAADSPDTLCIALLTTLDGRRDVSVLSGAEQVRTFRVNTEADSLDVISSSGETFVAVGDPSTVNVWSLSDPAWTSVP